MTSSANIVYFFTNFALPTLRWPMVVIVRAPPVIPCAKLVKSVESGCCRNVSMEIVFISNSAISNTTDTILNYPSWSRNTGMPDDPKATLQLIKKMLSWRHMILQFSYRLKALARSLPYDTMPILSPV